METTPHTGSQITITVELAQAAATIAQRHPDGAIRIEYRETDPENIWHVLAVGVETTKEYTVNDETGEIHAMDCDLDEDCTCQPVQRRAPKLTRSQRAALERCVMNNGWQNLVGSAHQAMARKLESYGYVTVSEGGGSMDITEAGRRAVGPV